MDIHLVFKTHLDIGFTDHASKVRALYHERFIPQAIETGEHFYAEDPEHPAFIWTTGAWLIWDHLASQDAAKVRRLELAIERGLIAWHGLPFTTHSELMSPALFRAGLSYAQELDARFGLVTRAAKMTDVPGHTIGMVPILAEAGIRFLHLGVNSASPVPDVPELFRWRAGGAEMVVMYQPSYGATHIPEGFAQGLSFAHTNDNMGPQSVPQVAEAHRHLREAHKEANIRASTLDAYGEALWARRAELPVVEEEIGDSWIHGAGSDPVKVARFLALQRLYDSFAAEALTPERRAFGRGLTLVAEHTWGVDIKSYLRDEKAWSRVALAEARAKDHRFDFSEASWREQRDYLDVAVAMLEPENKARAEAAMAPITPAASPGPMGESRLRIGDWTVEIDAASGDIVGLTRPGLAAVAGLGGSLFGYRYKSYDAGDVAAHMEGYLTERPDWALLDHGKPGLARERTALSQAFAPLLLGIERVGERVVLVLDLPEIAKESLGAPGRVEIGIEADNGGLCLSVTLRDKPANRMPEASFVHWTPAGASGWRFRKMGYWLDAAAVRPRGGGQLQAVEAASVDVGGAALSLSPLDTPLVGPAGTPFMPFCATRPDFSAGLRFNLHNNKWGTNFPMWWEGDLIARFRLGVPGG